MAYEPSLTITPLLLSHAEEIASLRERILASGVELTWVPALQKDSRSRNAHASTAIEGNPLTLAQVRTLDGKSRPLKGSDRSEREVLNYFAALRYVEKNAKVTRIGHDDILELHRIMAGKVMDQGEAGRYRMIQVRVGRHMPPPPGEVSGLMFELLTWWNKESTKLSPVLSSAILHHRFEDIHPFADGNGRTGRALALWELYRRGFDAHHIFTVDEYFWEDRPRYYDQLDRVRREGDGLTSWLEYCAEGLKQTLGRVWLRIQALKVRSPGKIVLSPKQERILSLLGAHSSMTPTEIWAALGLSRQGAMNVLNPLLEAGLVERVGGKKTGHYRLKP